MALSFAAAAGVMSGLDAESDRVVCSTSAQELEPCSIGHFASSSCS